MKQAMWFLVIALAFPAFPATMSHEETVVREAYAKLAYASDVYTVMQITSSDFGPAETNLGAAMQKIAENKLEYSLSDFKVGNIEDIKGWYNDYVHELDGRDVLQVTPNLITTMKDGKFLRRSLTAVVQWTHGERTPVPNAWKVPAVWMLSKVNNGISYERYAAYRVIVKFQGRERDYGAVAVFAPAKAGFGTVNAEDKEQREDVLFIDLITGNDALTFFAKPVADISPTDLKADSNNPTIEEWLRKNQPPSTEVQQPH